MLCVVPVLHGCVGIFAIIYGRRLFSSGFAITERSDIGLSEVLRAVFNMVVEVSYHLRV